MDSAKTAARQCENLLSVGIWHVLYYRLDGICTLAGSAGMGRYTGAEAWWTTCINNNDKGQHKSVSTAMNGYESNEK